MIRLVTQFDTPTARPAAATPSCCCCSCCCCCIVTIVSSSIYTAVSAQKILHKAERDAPERVRWGSPAPGVLGFFALPLAIVSLFLLGSVAASGEGEGVLIVGVAIWFGLVGLTYWAAGAMHPWARGFVVVFLASVAFVVELFIWAAALIPEDF